MINSNLRVRVQVGAAFSPRSRSRSKLVSITLGVALVVATSFLGATAASRRPFEPAAEPATTKQAISPRLTPLDAPARSVETDPETLRGLFSVQAHGIKALPTLEAADRFLATLAADQDGRSAFPADEGEWLDRMNVHSEARGRPSLKTMTNPQRSAALGVVWASLAAEGLHRNEAILKLKASLGTLAFHQQIDRFTLLGQPSVNEPWGWQLEGAHLVVNVFLLGDQAVVTPTYLGPEPTPGLAFVKTDPQP